MLIMTPFILTLMLPLTLLISSFFNLKFFTKIAGQALLLTSSLAFLFWNYCLYCYFVNVPLPAGSLPPIHLSVITMALHFKIDMLSIIFGGLSSFLFILVSAFSKAYLKRDRSEARFYFLISLLLFSLQIVAASASFDAIAVGWEIAGISSVFLIGFFISNIESTRRSLYAFINYKIGDVALLTAIGLIHINIGDVSLALPPNVTYSNSLFWISFLIILATAAKSSQFPLSSWIKKAVEGPSSSTAIFYGAISIHLGPFLLLRTQSWWDSFSSLRILIFMMGLVTLVLSTFYARTRNDAKTVLIASSQAQVGIMYLTLALGLYPLTILHLVGHAGLRTWQLLRASSLIHDFQDNLSIFQWMTTGRFKMSNGPLFIKLREGFYIEATMDYLVKSIQLQIQKMPCSISVHIMVTISIILVSLGLEPWIEQWKLLLLFPTLLISLQAISTKNIKVSIYAALLSQILHIWLGQMRSASANSLFLSVLIFEAPLFALYAYWSERWLKFFNNKLPAPIYYGLGEQHPQGFALLSIIGILISGAPIGLTFFFEELVFHNTFASSILVTLVTLLIAGLNTVTLTKNTFRLFGGPSHVGVTALPISLAEKLITGLSITCYLLTMIYPQPFLDFLTYFLNVAH